MHLFADLYMESLWQVTVNPFHADDDSCTYRPFVPALPMTTPGRFGPFVLAQPMTTPECLKWLTCHCR